MPPGMNNQALRSVSYTTYGGQVFEGFRAIRDAYLIEILFRIWGTNWENETKKDRGARR